MSYYGRPVLKEPVWKWYIPAYFFTGGLAAGSSVLALGGRLTGRRRLAQRSRAVSVAAMATSAAFLVEDLGRPSRFANMLRVAKPSSPMSVGSWLLAAYGPATGLAWATRGRLVAADLAAGALAPAVATYTGALLATTAVPAWRDAHAELPLLFAASAAASAGGMALVIAPAEEARPARRLAVIGAAAELAAAARIERHGPYGEGRAGRLSHAARALTVAGLALSAASGTGTGSGTGPASRSGRPRRRAAAAGGLCLLAGAAAERFAVFHAGVQSTRA